MTYGFDSARELAAYSSDVPADFGSDFLAAELDGRMWMAMRASGTEPKVKIYVEAVDTESEAAAKSEAQRVATVIADWWLGSGFRRTEDR